MSSIPEQPEGAVRRAGFGAAGSGAFSVLLVGSLFALFPIGAFIAPLGVVPVLQYQSGKRPGIFAWGWVVAALAIAMLVPGIGSYAAVLLGAYVLVVVVPSLATAAWGRYGWTEGRWAAVAALALAALAIAAVVVLSWPVAPVDASLTWVRSFLEWVEQVSAGALKDVGEIQLDILEQKTSWLLPAIPIAYLMGILFWVRPRLPLLGYPMAVGAFEDYRSEELLPAAFAVTGAATLLLEGTLRWVALNLLVTVLLLYFVHGLAIIRAHLARFVGRRWYVRWGVALVCLTNPLPPVVALLGLADSFFNLRPRPREDGGAA